MNIKQLLTSLETWLRKSEAFYRKLVDWEQRITVGMNLMWSYRINKTACTFLTKHSEFRNLSSYIKEISFVQSLSAIIPKARRSAYNLAFKLKIVFEIYSHSISKELSIITWPKQKKIGWCELVLRKVNIRMISAQHSRYNGKN